MPRFSGVVHNCVLSLYYLFELLLKSNELEIEEYVSTGASVSKYIKKLMNHEEKLFSKYNVTSVLDGPPFGSYMFSVELLANVSTNVRDVYLPQYKRDDDTDLPCCNCSFFRNRNIPCRHIATALYYNNQQNQLSKCQQPPPLINFDDISCIPPRWRLMNHPIYKINHLKQSPTTISIRGAELNHNQNAQLLNQERQQLHKQLCKIRFPTKEDVKNSQLSSICLPVFEMAKRSQYNYKMVVYYLTKFNNGLVNFFNTEPSLRNDCMDHINNAPSFDSPEVVNDKFTSIVNHAKYAKKRNGKYVT